MSDNDGKKTLGVRSGPRASNVKQSFSHGRSKNVVVETKRKRVVVPKAGTTTTGIQSSNLDRAKGLASGVSDTEMERRLKALQAAKAREADEVAQREASAKEREKEREQRRLEQENRQRELKKAEEIKSEKEAQAEATKKQAEEQAKRAAVEAKTVTKPDAPQRREFSDSKSTRPSSPNSRKKDRESDDRSSGRGRGDEGRRSGKLTLSQALDGGERSHQKSMAAMKRKQERARQKAIGQPLEREKIVRDVQVPEAIIVSELANRMAERSAEFVKSLMKMGMMVTQNQVIDADTAELIIEEFGHKIVRVSASDVEDAITEIKDNPEDLKPRPPVITIMGHVDHGKTSLLDSIRNAKVVSGEAGGITQHIGAYQVKTKDGTVLSFLDTPGHAAFTSMRSRGAQVTDIVVLVVAADDSVMPQTVEAINHAKAAQVPMIVAINKCDRPEANPDKVRTELLQHEVIVEAMSGEVQDVEVSAVTGKGIDELLDAIALQSEILELKANNKRAAHGAVIEAQLDVGRGPVATVLVQNGTLKQGKFLLWESNGEKSAHLSMTKVKEFKKLGHRCRLRFLV